MKKIGLLICTAVMLSSCSKTFYQVFSINAEDAAYTPNGSPVYTTDGLEFTYNFWGENGNVKFIIYNSNEYDVIVDLTKSSFIRNNIADDYYQGRQYETRVATGVFKSSKDGVAVTVNKQAATSTLVNYMGRTYDVALSVGASVEANTETGSAVKKEWQTAIVYTEPETVRIPAKSAKAFCFFNINSTKYPQEALKVDDNYVEFSKANSPLEFRNRICIYKDGEESTFYNMNFYINMIENVSSLIDMEKPTNFYIQYSSTGTGSGNSYDSSTNSLVDKIYHKIAIADTDEQVAEIEKEVEAAFKTGGITQSQATSIHDAISRKRDVISQRYN